MNTALGASTFTDRRDSVRVAGFAGSRGTVLAMNHLRGLWERSPRAVLGVAGAVVLALVAGLILLGTGGGDSPDAGAPVARPVPGAPEGSPQTAEPSYETVVAAALIDVIEVFAEPAIDGPPTVTVDRREELSGQVVFVVIEQRGDWLNVQLPVRPNGSTGWIRAADVSLSSHEFAITVELSAHRMTATNAGEQILETSIGVGTADAPTPGGTYYIKELLQPPNQGGPYGTYAYGLSGFSNVFTSYAGGPGVIGIHGTNRPETVGTDVSDGCIRTTNEVMSQLVEEIGIPLGTPVEIIG